MAIHQEVTPTTEEEGVYSIPFSYLIKGISSFNSIYIGNFQTDAISWRLFYKEPQRDGDKYYLGSYIPVPNEIYRTINRFVRGNFERYRDYFKTLEDIKNDYQRQKRRSFFFEVDENRNFLNGWDIINDPQTHVAEESYDLNNRMKISKDIANKLLAEGIFTAQDVIDWDKEMTAYEYHIVELRALSLIKEYESSSSYPNLSSDIQAILDSYSKAMQMDWYVAGREDGKQLGLAQLVSSTDEFGNDVSYYYEVKNYEDGSMRLRFNRPCRGSFLYATTSEIDAMTLGYISTDRYEIDILFQVRTNLFNEELFTATYGSEAKLSFIVDGDVEEVELEDKTYYRAKGCLSGDGLTGLPLSSPILGELMDAGSFILFNRNNPQDSQGYAVKSLAQIIRIEGDGSDKDGITILTDENPHDFFFQWDTNYLLKSVRLGLVRAGYSQKYPNPQVGAGRTYKDFSVRNELINGGYQYINRNVARVYSGSLILTRDLAATFLDFSEKYRAKPFPVEILSNMEKEYPAVMFCALEGMPDEKLSYRTGELRDISFQFKEIF